MATTFSAETYSVNLYDIYRPRYPIKLYDTIMEYHRGGKELAVDLGCGTGIVSGELVRSDRFDKVIGVDPSKMMIEHAQKYLQVSGLEFRVGRAEALDGVEAASVDMLIAGTAAHWFPPSWWNEAARVLKPDGTIAIFIYGGMWPDPHHPQADELRATMFSFVTELGHSSTGNVVCHNMYDELPMPTKSDFIDFQRVDWNRNGTGDSLLMSDKMTLAAWRKRVHTFGPAHRWRVDNPTKCGTLEDPVERVAEKIKQIASLDESTEFVCGHSLSLILLRRSRNL
ncbi:hypothetical protein CROQUDRAFT_42905 [Cronartium quercuum f. sp. fusiforme G11]|uniref:Methyltransferase type 11 domain-containing protein n=1 Tax=Cronartium quercuum f. sp. fusiforme G11 TaxID=708437 RepID=A0A9P6NI74_9BASI|nr:hypothetical protein CROQUDRAFT_42905 [Cronartium quercuum f. sp. fusiforme G11]